ncbi:unnamed protein product [Echinostoma caproni]|uniref:Uncharacterized protein n=1 Tax=Echinostoma caproni TaxID=27848 RepID=A0A183B494_9TREM|nr:unnamed protein product [Echinostoma caproni]
MEAATVAADLGKLFRLIRVAARKRQTSDPLLRNTLGQIIRGTEQKMQIAAQPPIKPTWLSTGVKQFGDLQNQLRLT